MTSPPLTSPSRDTFAFLLLGISTRVHDSTFNEVSSSLLCWEAKRPAALDRTQLKSFMRVSGWRAPQDPPLVLPMYHIGMHQIASETPIHKRGRGKLTSILPKVGKSFDFTGLLRCFLRAIYLTGRGRFVDLSLLFRKAVPNVS